MDQQYNRELLELGEYMIIIVCSFLASIDFTNFMMSSWEIQNFVMKYVSIMRRNLINLTDGMAFDMEEHRRFILRTGSRFRNLRIRYCDCQASFFQWILKNSPDIVKLIINTKIGNDNVESQQISLPHLKELHTSNTHALQHFINITSGINNLTTMGFDVDYVRNPNIIANFMRMQTQLKQLTLKIYSDSVFLQTIIRNTDLRLTALALDIEDVPPNHIINLLISQAPSLKELDINHINSAIFDAVFDNCYQLEKLTLGENASHPEWQDYNRSLPQLKSFIDKRTCYNKFPTSPNASIVFSTLETLEIDYHPPRETRRIRVPILRTFKVKKLAGYENDLDLLVELIKNVSDITIQTLLSGVEDRVLFEKFALLQNLKRAKIGDVVRLYE